MAVASLVLGIVSVIIAIVPLCGTIAFLPALIGLILGIVALVKANKEEGGKKGMPIAGIITSVVAIAFIVYYLYALAQVGGEFLDEVGEQIQQEIENGNLIINENGEIELSEDAMNSLIENIEVENTEVENVENEIIENIENQEPVVEEEL